MRFKELRLDPEAEAKEPTNFRVFVCNQSSVALGASLAAQEELSGCTMKSLKLKVSKDGEWLEDKVLPLDEETIIGRSADLVLSHKSISRQHAHIDPTTGDVVLKNLAKDGGTRVNEHDLKSGEQVVLSAGDKIKFGKSSKVYTLVMDEYIKDVRHDPVNLGSFANISDTVPVKPSSTREEREVEIAAMTASMLNPVTTLKIKKEEVCEDDSSDDDTFGPQPSVTNVDEGQVKKETKEGEGDLVKDEAKRLNIPINQAIDLSKHNKMVMCLSSNPSGNRIVSGSHDGSCKMFDFGGMDTRLLAFKEFYPEAGVAINDISYSPSGDRIMIVLSNAQPLLFDKDGSQAVKFIRGDMYLTDLTNTKGHASEVTCVVWHPKDNNVVLTGSMDGTLRSWNLESERYLGMLRNRHGQVMKVRPKQGGSQSRITVNSCCYSPDGSLMIAGCADGSIHVWNEKSVSRPRGVFRVGSGSVSFVTCLPSSLTNGKNVLTAKTTEGNVCFFDLREVCLPNCTPFMVCEGCPNDSAGANVAFNADCSLMCVPTNTLQGSSLLCFFRLEKFETQKKPLHASLVIPVADTSRTGRILWQHNINQIFVALSDGSIKAFFDPDLSKKGVLLCVNKAPPRRTDPSDFVHHVGHIYAPHALPMFREDIQANIGNKRKQESRPNTKIHENNASDGQASHVQRGVSEATKFILSGRRVHNAMAENPRDALIKLEGKTGGVSAFVSNAYKDTQPKSVLASKTYEQEEEELNALKRQRKDPI